MGVATLDNLTSSSPSAASYEGASVRVPKTAEVVADQIRRKIVRGELNDGDFLPPEAAMLANLSISRPTLREAFRILEAERLITVGRGARTGARVNRPLAENAARYAGFVLQADKTTIHDIYEARLAIEPFIAYRLAETRSPEAIARLSSEADRLRRLVDENRYVDFMIGLAEFHQTLVEVGGNKTLSFVTQMLQAIVARHQVEHLTTHPLPIETQRKRAIWGLKSFQRLIELIASGEAGKAEAHWRLHVSNANASWVPPAEAAKVIDIA